MKNYQTILITLSLLFISIISFSQTKNDVFLKANEGHTDVVTDFALSHDNKYLVSCSEDKNIILWDFETAKEIKRITGHQQEISCIDINNDNTQIASGESGKELDTKYSVKIWNIKTGEEIRTIKPNAGKIKFVKFVDNGKFLLIAGTIKILYYDLETGKKIRDYLGLDEELKNFSISKDQKIIAAQTSKNIIIWDINQRAIVKSIENNGALFTSIKLDYNGNNLLAGFKDNSLKVYNTISGKEIKNMEAFRYPIQTLTIDDKNQFILASDSKSKYFKIINFNTTQEIHSIEAHDAQVGRIKISDNNRLIITAGSWDKSIKVWDLATGNFIKSFSGIDKDIFDHAYIDSSNYYAIGKIRNKAFLNYLSKQINNQTYKDKNGEVSCIAISPNKQLLAFGTSKNISKICNTNSQKEIYNLTGQKSWIRKIAFGYNGKLLATASFEQIKIWNSETGKEIISIDKAFKVPYSICFSKDNKKIAVGGRKMAKVFDIETGKEINTFKIKTIAYALDFSHDNKFLVVGEGFKTERDKYKITIWNLENGKNTQNFNGHERQITAIKFSYGDSLIVSSGNKLIKIWNITSGKKIKEIKAHERWINDIEFGFDNQRLISTSQDGTTKIWDLTTGQLLLTEIGLKNTNNWISYTPDGRFDGTNKGIKSLYFVKDMQIVPLENLYEQFYTPFLNADISKNNLDTNLNISNLKNLADIEITKPSNKAPMFRGAVETLLSTKEKTTNISANFINTGGGIDEVRIYQNNKLIISEKIDSVKKGNEISRNYDINLAKGLNTIEVASYNKDRTKNAKRIGIEYTGDEFNEANLYIFAIGINEYKKSTYNLNYAVSDATAFTQALTKDSNQIFKNIELISLTNQQATSDSIKACFENIKDKANQNDVFIFYYAGHGSMSAPDGNSKAEFYLIPWGITNLYNNQMLQNKGISARQLQTYSKEIKAQKQLFLLDACQSGGAVEYLSSRGSEEEKAIAQLAHSTGTYFITASGSQQLAGEFEALGHGVFTYAVLQALNGDASIDNKVTVKELTLFVEEKVPEISKKYKGNAQYPASYGFGQDFPIILINNKK